MLASEGLFFALGALLEASGAEKKTLDRPLSALGKISRQVSAEKNSWTALGRSKRNSKTGFSYLGGQKAPKREAKRVENGVQEATRAENANSSKSIVFSMKIIDF